MNELLNDETQARQSGDSFDLELGRLLDHITARLIAGECLDLEALAREHREHAEALRELVPAMAAVAKLGQPELESKLQLVDAQWTDESADRSSHRELARIIHGGPV